MKVKNVKTSTRTQRITTDQIIINPCKSVLIRVTRVPFFLDCRQ